MCMCGVCVGWGGVGGPAPPEGACGARCPAPRPMNAPTTGGYDMRPLDAGTLTVSLTPAEH